MAVRTIKSRLPIRGVRIAGANDESVIESKQYDATPATPPMTPAPKPEEPESTETQPAALTSQKTDELIESLIETVTELEDRRNQSFAELQMAAIEIGVLVASRVAYEKINADDFAVEELVNTALERIDANVPVVIRLHPADHTLLLNRFTGDEIKNVMPSVKFEADSSISRGDCQADTVDFGLVTTVEQRIGELRTLLLEGIEDAQIERRKNGKTSRSIRRFPDRRETA